MRFEKKLKTMKSMNNPNFYVKNYDEESIRSKSFSSQKNSFHLIERGPATNSSFNEFAYQQETRPHTKSVVSRS